MEFISTAAPRSIRLVEERRRLELHWDEQSPLQLQAAWLREQCRCAACEQRRRLGHSICVNIDMKIMEIKPFGAAGVQIVFSDGHQRGAFPWSYLRLLAEQAPSMVPPPCGEGAGGGDVAVAVSRPPLPQPLLREGGGEISEGVRHSS